MSKHDDLDEVDSNEAMDFASWLTRLTMAMEILSGIDFRRLKELAPDGAPPVALIEAAEHFLDVWDESNPSDC